MRADTFLPNPQPPDIYHQHYYVTHEWYSYVLLVVLAVTSYVLIQKAWNWFADRLRQRHDHPEGPDDGEPGGAIEDATDDPEAVKDDPEAVERWRPPRLWWRNRVTKVIHRSTCRDGGVDIQPIDVWSEHAAQHWAMDEGYTGCSLCHPFDPDVRARADATRPSLALIGDAVSDLTPSETAVEYGVRYADGHVEPDLDTMQAAHTLITTQIGTDTDGAVVVRRHVAAGPWQEVRAS